MVTLISTLINQSRPMTGLFFLACIIWPVFKTFGLFKTDEMFLDYFRLMYALIKRSSASFDISFTTNFLRFIWFFKLFICFSIPS